MGSESGATFPARTGPSSRFASVGNLVEQRRERLIRDKLIASTAAEAGPALAVAALLEGMPADELMRSAINRFRSVQWHTLQANSHIITGGGMLQDVGAGEPDLFRLSAPCRLSGCDMFWSHSWSDSGTLKWQVVSAWALAFEHRENRRPSLWLDKVCIDQSKITDDLRCLPVFLAGCNGLLVTAGSTYASRLWCALELFVYFSMTSEDATRSSPTVLLLGSDSKMFAWIRLSWLAFDVQGCNCYHTGDKSRILQVIDQFPAGCLGFNNYIRGLASKMLDDANDAPADDSGSPATIAATVVDASADEGSMESFDVDMVYIITL